jgi:hypothetical protein
VREKQAAPVAAERHKGKSLRLCVMHAQNVAKNLLRGFVCQRAKRFEGVLRASARFEFLSDSLSLVLGLWSEDGQGS